MAGSRKKKSRKKKKKKQEKHNETRENERLKIRKGGYGNQPQFCNFFLSTLHTL